MGDGCGCVAPEQMCPGCQVICCCLMAANQNLKQSLDPVWSHCYLTGPDDLDKSLEFCACGFIWVGFGFFARKLCFCAVPALCHTEQHS